MPGRRNRTSGVMRIRTQLAASGEDTTAHLETYRSLDARLRDGMGEMLYLFGAAAFEFAAGVRIVLDKVEIAVESTQYLYKLLGVPDRIIEPFYHNVFERDALFDSELIGPNGIEQGP